MATTSDLSIDEALLLEEVGFEPLEFVMGSSFYHIGYQFMPLSGLNTEFTVLTGAMTNARHQALRRLQAQARAAGADGVVGVRLHVDHHHHNAEFVAMGTAVRAREGRWKVDGQPFMSDLSGQDFWALVRAGFRPCGMAFGCCVYHVGYSGLGTWLNSIGNNCEMPNYTQALYDARELAMGRMQREAHSVGASGVVGVQVREGSYGWHSHIIEFLAIGTAIAPTGRPVEHDPVAPVLAVNG